MEEVFRTLENNQTKVFTPPSLMIKYNIKKYLDISHSVFSPLPKVKIKSEEQALDLRTSGAQLLPTSKSWARNFFLKREWGEDGYYHPQYKKCGPLTLLITTLLCLIWETEEWFFSPHVFKRNISNRQASRISSEQRCCKQEIFKC